tara:strand:+ start:301 stop:483 length:183 start_codon:yes stop_codon:yes gene_type:complete
VIVNTVKILRYKLNVMRIEEILGLKEVEIEVCNKRLIKLNLKAQRCKTRKKAIKILSKVK